MIEICGCFHSARQGRKIEILKRKHRVCFEFEAATKINPGKTACAWGMNFKRVIGYGTAGFIEDAAEKRRALDTIMAQYAEGDSKYAHKALSKTLVIKVDISHTTGKKSD
ncbi:MAG: pyridoxamine 5'-phosphate oxidase family protein [Desulfobacterales bacterium]|nr:pyridoxamine 5'-phosphate oxidase family protein [Desulfobacterales bacterium]